MELYVRMSCRASSILFEETLFSIAYYHVESTENIK